MAKHFFRSVAVFAVGCVAFAIAARAISNANRPQWEYIGAPSQRASAIAATWPDLIVTTSDGATYRHCERQCWELAPAPESQEHLDQTGPSCTQVKTPPLPSTVAMRLECDYTYGATITYRAYAIDSHGQVFRWQMTIGDMDWLNVYPLAGLVAAVVVLLGLIIVGAFAFQDALEALSRRQRSRH